MNKKEAVKMLKSHKVGWIDFELWAYLQLEIKGEFTQERMYEVLQNHKNVERAEEKYQKKTHAHKERMKSEGKTPGEIKAYDDARWHGLQFLVKAWRSIDGLPV